MMRIWIAGFIAAAMPLFSSNAAEQQQSGATQSAISCQSVTGNKAVACNVIDRMWNQKDPESAAKLLAPDYVEHLPGVTDPSRKGFVEAAKAILAQFPHVSAHIHKLVEDGNIVVAYVNWKPVPGQPGFATADFFRFEDGKLKEHWGVAQPVPTGDAAKNPNSMF